MQCPDCKILMRQTNDGLLVKRWVCDGCGKTITEHKGDESENSNLVTKKIDDVELLSDEEEK